MKKEKLVIPIIAVIMIIAVVIVYIFIGKNAKQAKVVARSKEIIKENGFKYKDLNSNGKLDKYENWNLSSEERAEDLINQMTLEEKAGVILISTQTMGVDQEDKTLTSHDGIIDEETTSSPNKIYENKTGTTKSITELNIRHVILRAENSAEDISKWTNLLNEMAEETRLGIPVVVTANSKNEVSTQKWDSTGDIVTEYPGTLGIAAAALGEIKNTGNSKIVENFASTINQEWRAMGIRKGYMYMADVATDPRWLRVYGTFGEGTEFVADTMTKLVKGIQGEELDENGVALTLKHFPGSGARIGGNDAHFASGKYAFYQIENSMEKYHLQPFVAAINAGVSSIMPYYSIPTTSSAKQTYKGKEIKMDGPSFAYNSDFLITLLRDEMGFEGYVNTDSGILDYIYWGEEERTQEERAADALNAGTDLISDTNRTDLIIGAYNNGLITEETLNTACKRVLIEMFDLGLFENPYTDEKKVNDKVKTEENIKNAYDAHVKSVTLLKNKENALPLSNDKLEGKKVYLQFIGIMKEYYYIDTVKENIKKLDENIVLVDKYEDADYAIIYLLPAVTNQILNRRYVDIEINDSSLSVANTKLYQTICDKIHENNGQVITVVNFDNPWVLTNIEPYTDGLIGVYSTYTKAWYEVIRGQYNPTGVLPFTLPASQEVIALDDNGNCVSPNDVPGYDKNNYMPEGMKYEYVDEMNNSYTYNFGLTY